MSGMILPEIGVHFNEVAQGDDLWQGAVWPISAPALAALVDLGLSDERIARYFHVGPSNVQALRLCFAVPPEHS